MQAAASVGQDNLAYAALPSLQTRSKQRANGQSWAGASLLTAAAIAAAGAAALHGRAADCDAAAAPAAKNLPTISRAEVAKHKTKDTSIYVIYGDGVYDITDFIANHPGGANKIILAAGGNVEPFWKLYAVHQKAVVLDILSSMRIGSLPPDEVVLPKKAGDDDDPYAHVSCSTLQFTLS
jgi:cytochrome b involved in lipid metabolism